MPAADESEITSICIIVSCNKSPFLYFTIKKKNHKSCKHSNFCAYSTKYIFTEFKTASSIV